MRVHWATDYDLDGNRLGFSVHNRRSREALVASGVTLDDSAEVAVHVATADSWTPVAGKFNVLYTAWEAHELPEQYAAGARRADLIVVPAEFLVDVFATATGRPVRCCPLGVDVDLFQYRERPRRPGERLRFLWVGAPNARKGWPAVAAAWEMLRSLDRRGLVDFDCELYVKTTVTERKVELGDGVTWDSRRLALDDLAALYHRAHAFLFPTMGEGFGLTLAEAMATGLPCIYTPWTAAAELMAPGCGWGLQFETTRVDLEGTHLQGASATFAQADPGDLARKMLRLLKSPRDARRRGRRAARRIRERFTWEHTGARLRAILEEVRCLQAVI